MPSRSISSLAILGGFGLLAFMLSKSSTSGSPAVGYLPAAAHLLTTKTVEVRRSKTGIVSVAVPAKAKVANFLSVIKGAGGVDVFNAGVEVTFISDPNDLASIKAFLTGPQLLARYHGRVLIPNGVRAITIFNPSMVAPLACTLVFELA